MTAAAAVLATLPAGWWSAEQARTYMLAAAVDAAASWAERAILATTSPPRLSHRVAADWIERVAHTHFADMQAETAEIADSLEVTPDQRRQFEADRAAAFDQRLVELAVLAAPHRGRA